MRLSRNRFRMIYAALVIVSFFIPAYQNVSAFEFFSLAIGDIRSEADVTLLDLVVILIPLLLIPFTALYVLMRAANKKPMNGLLLGLPLFSFAFFFLILSLDINRNVNNVDVLELLKEMSFGFYITAMGALLLLFTYSKKEALNVGAGKG